MTGKYAEISREEIIAYNLIRMGKGTRNPARIPVAP